MSDAKHLTMTWFVDHSLNVPNETSTFGHTTLEGCKGKRAKVLRLEFE